MLSNRPTQQQLVLQFDLGDDVDELTTVEEPQRGQSDSANTKQPSLDSFQNDLMEEIVDTDNMMNAWNNVRRNSSTEPNMTCDSPESHAKSRTNGYCN